MIRELDYERSTAQTTRIAPVVVPADRPSIGDRWEARPKEVSELIVLIGGLLALAIALAHIGSATQAQAVAWAFVVTGVLAALRRWA